MDFRLAAAALRGLIYCVVVSLATLAPAQAQRGADTGALDQAEIAALEAGVSAAESIRSIKRLQHIYAALSEEGAWSAAADLLTDDVAADFAGRSASGKSAVRAHLMAEAGRDAEGLAPGQLNAHLIMQPIVTLGADGRTARGTWHEVALLGRFGEDARWRGGIYENEYVVEGGVWKIARIRYIEQYRGAYEEFGHTAPPAWNVPYHFVADDVGVTIPESALRAPAGGDGNGREARAARRAADLERRVARLADETAVRNLQHAFGYYLDRKLYDDVADLFAANGTFEADSSGVFVGPARIREALEAHYGPTPLARGELFDHVMLGTVVTIAPDGRSAAARTSEVGMFGRTGDFARWQLGTYENTFVKDGSIWKLQSVRYFQRMATSYDLGWAEDAAQPTTVAARLAPDRPSTHTHATYPERYPIEFHFTHPVTGKPIALAGERAVSVGLVRGSSPGRGDGANRNMPLAQRLAAVRKLLDAAIAVDAVENLMSSYGYYIDESDWNSMADTFARTGSKEITGAGVYVGPERIRTVLNLRGPRNGRSPTFFTIHQLVQPVIHVDPDGLHANARLRLFQSGGNADGSSGSWIGGIYENTAVQEDGEWKFGVQDLTHTFNASYRNGWARVGGATLPVALPSRPAAAPPAASARNVQGGGITQGLGGAASPSSFARDFPPDRPIRARQYAFPEIVEPAFHYVNPVSGRRPQELLEH